MGTSTAISRRATSSRAGRAHLLPTRLARRPALAALALLAAAAVSAAADTAPSIDSLRGSLEEAVRAARPAAPVVGVHVIDLLNGREVFSHAADELRIVASNTKLVTTAAALDRLGPGYFFETEMAVRGWLLGEWLEGDLGIVGGGDPNISGRSFDGDPLAVFRGWAARLKELGIRRISGDLYLANGRFEPLRVHPDWPRDQLGRWYEAPVDALSFSDNCQLVRVLPAARPGLPARVEVVPGPPQFEIRNRASTTSSARRHRVSIHRAAGSRVVDVAGRVYRGAEPVEAWVTVPDPVAYFGSALRRALADEGVEVGGELRHVSGLPEDGWRRLAVHRTDLLTAVEVTNKNSQNFFAESLLKVLGLELCGDGSWGAGLEVLREFLASIGIPPGSYSLADGSGMSRNNRFTPRQLTHLLRHMFGHPLGREFALSMPASGGPEGRWKTRLSEPRYRDNVLAKTGSLSGVSTLSGYAKAGSGRVYAFSILCNAVPSVWDARRAQDRIVRALIDHG